MITETDLIFRVREYKGCDIQAASYRLGANGWVPEACFSLETEKGMRRVWIASFAHCFGMHDLIFRNKIEADNCAFSMARTLIDKTLPEFERNSVTMPSSQNNYVSKLRRAWRRRRLKQFP